MPRQRKRKKEKVFTVTGSCCCRVIKRHKPSKSPSASLSERLQPIAAAHSDGRLQNSVGIGASSSTQQLSVLMSAKNHTLHPPNPPFPKKKRKLASINANEMCLEMSQWCQTQGVRSKKKEKKRQIKQGNIQYGHREAVLILKCYNFLGFFFSERTQRINPRGIQV